ncbi:cupin domain-containing protein [Cellulosimicrobium funkei]
MTDVRNLLAALDTFDGHWQPHRVASLNDADVKVVKVLGEFVWHTHPETDELFLVLDGELTIDLRDGGVERAVVLGPHDLFVVPRGVEHRPRATVETSAVLVERQGTVNTGDAGGDLTSPLRELPDAPPTA